ncbi:MAG: hypothetical protein Q4B94_01865 [Pseudomonadota bacterium]|nr:hypothetical protein [Pseudomonadota bacterium]
MGNLPGGLPGNVVGKDAAHHGGLRRVDFTLAGACDAVAIGQAAGGFSGQCLAGQAAPGLVGQVSQVQLGHDAAQPDFGLMAFAAGVHAIAHANDADTFKFQCPQHPVHFQAIA